MHKNTFPSHTNNGDKMKKVPKMISTKDLAYISDMFNWNIVAYEKINYYNTDITDATISNKFEELAQMHLDNCNKLIKILESGE